MKSNRRSFLNGLLGIGLLGWAGSALYPIISFLIPPKIPEANVHQLKAGKSDDYPVNSSSILNFGRKPVILIRKKDESFIAFAATCTHLDCIVQYRPESEHILCACHNGIYDLKGRNASGPPPKPLEEFVVNVIDGEIIISKPQNVS